MSRTLADKAAAITMARDAEKHAYSKYESYSPETGGYKYKKEFHPLYVEAGKLKNVAQHEFNRHKSSVDSRVKNLMRSRADKGD